MLKKLALIVALSFGSPALAATTSVQLDDLAAQVESATALNHNFDIAALNLLREPALTYANRTLPSGGAPYYTTSIDMTSNSLRPPQPWTMALQEIPAPPPVGNSSNRFYSASFMDWVPGPSPDGGLKWESGGQSRVNRASAVLVAALRAWAFVLRQNGR
jgi:hypothetical protein